MSDIPEHEFASRLAEKVLDQHWRDPDDDLSVLARQLLRRLEEVDRLRARETELKQALVEIERAAQAKTSSSANIKTIWEIREYARCTIRKHYEAKGSS